MYEVFSHFKKSDPVLDIHYSLRTKWDESLQYYREINTRIYRE
jgi:hypothetical protein